MKKSALFLLLFYFSLFGIAQSYSIQGEILIAEKADLSQVTTVFLQEKGVFAPISKQGLFSFDSLKNGTYTVTVFSEGYETVNNQVVINNNSPKITIALKKLSQNIEDVTIQESKQNSFGIGRLKPVEGTAIYAGKKSEVISVQDISANLATNNSRQIYSKVAGLNIWESDGAGIQLGIGGRGLNPNRVSNFNTRQNGYDISADALGYPESYYSPPAEAINQIQIVRGAASLQYGTQFGGFLNFKLNDGPEKKKIEIVSRQTVGSFGLFNSFNSVGGN